jgi:NNP family nitrate/nitrite transporter-like MFS transporter
MATPTSEHDRVSLPRDPGAAPSTGDRLRAAVAQVGVVVSSPGKSRVLHRTWFAFFLSFVVWFNFAPFSETIREQLHLTKGQMLTLSLCNVALTVPARLFIGMALDRFGPRRTFATILIYAALPCTLFATAQDFSTLVLSRLLVGIVGAGFVVGIRMVSEWFPPKELGTAEGIYGGWGNFGAAFAALALPLVAALVGGPEGWRWAAGASGAVAAVYGVVYLAVVRDTPEGVTYSRPRRQGALEVTSRSAVFGLAALTVPLFAVLAVIAVRIWSAGVFSAPALVLCLAVIAALAGSQLVAVFRVNGPALRGDYAPADQYPLHSVAALCFAYFCTFGSELAVVSMLPTFFTETWGLGAEAAGFAAGSFAFFNIVTRPGGGLLSDLLGSRRRTLVAMLGGLTAGFVLMATLGSAWPVALAVVVSCACSVFGQAGNGAVYAIVPLVKKRVSGQVSGLAGAYGNVGALLFLTSLLWVPPRVFFLVIAAASLTSTLVARRWLSEPEASFAGELLTDRSVTTAPTTAAGAGERPLALEPATA